MGRGRQKAKQTKVARSLKYRSVEPDLASLERELRGEKEPVENSYDDVPPQYADIAAKYNRYYDEHDSYDD
ncbi:DUF3073 domain-containing protein [Propionimicrobium lymphophilum]|uniref:DUF3073 domain-containing protein n=1 Tax=Propionimicrobium lymphophilum ACS-093-V-SCH5 TaxID=883161 RepID=S2VY54_9ACTN|nr:MULTISPECIES: DUF3073 domain-containing protein [Propionimicrobium]EPD32468.1 hypothetical protein HMPREF9306_02040 [Propionimicrobium lymphophilum ACS-093-V-SCH5]ETJ97202.1 PF11273 family protein [Propionimicrobium sp. BV2F7]MDK7710698.1 DUF3073 domain-containing protein [Propionimicrobium lymphophilum]MDK7734349.1 DUF3073 domain-containing protein [Propionimicrobium lymphophilum]